MGGAEIYHVQIVRNLIRASHGVDVLTTTGGGFEPKTRFGLLWREEKSAGDSREDLGASISARVIRCPIKNPSLPSLWFACYRLQKQFELENAEFDPSQVRPVSRPHCFTGWQFPEAQGSEVWRWCGSRASIVLPPGARRLLLSGQAPWRRNLTITTAVVEKLFNGAVSGSFDIVLQIPDDPQGVILWLDMPVRWGPAKDVRTLGLYFNRIIAESAGGTTAADLWEDFHHSVSRHYLNSATTDSPSDGWIEKLSELARRRDAKFSALFDLARGPQSPALEKWLLANANQYDAIIAANFPFATPSTVMRHLAAIRKPIALLPLMHLDDEYYFWSHYIDYIASADSVLTISKYSERAFNHMGAKAHFVGVGIEPDMLEPAPADDVSAFRAKAGLALDEPYVLMVCRKSPTKNYPIVINAMTKVQGSNSARLVFIGKEEDNVALDQPFVIRMEGLTNAEMRAAYAGAAVFVLMSDSESFGMVFLEAWAQGAPVIGSAWCRPVAALIEHGVDGFLARDENSLAEHLKVLLADDEAARAMGRRGRDKVLRDFTQQAMTNRLSSAMEHLVK